MSGDVRNGHGVSTDFGVLHDDEVQDEDEVYREICAGSW